MVDYGISVIGLFEEGVGHYPTPPSVGLSRGSTGDPNYYTFENSHGPPKMMGFQIKNLLSKCLSSSATLDFQVTRKTDSLKSQITHRKTNECPLQRNPFKRKCHLPTINFQGTFVSPTPSGTSLQRWVLRPFESM